MAENNTAASENTNFSVSEPSSINQDNGSGAPAAPVKKRNYKRLFVISLVVLVNLAMGTTSGMLLTKKDSQSGQTASALAPAKTIAPAEKPKTNVSITNSKNLHFVSDAMNTEFDYPANWHISSDSADKNISISSPLDDFQLFTGETVKGRVAISIDAKYSTSNAYFDGTGKIVADSEALAYKNPTAAQRKTTEISFASYAGSQTSAIEFMFISGANSYKKGQTVSTYKYQAVEPFVTIYIDSCSEKCQGLSIGEISHDTYKTNPTIMQAVDIIKSFRFTK